MQVGDLVMYRERYKDTIGIIIKRHPIQHRLRWREVTVQWSGGKTLIEFENELEVINE